MSEDRFTEEGRERRLIEEGIEELGDPEGSPAIPSASLAAAAMAALAKTRRLARLRGSGEIVQLAWPVMASQFFVSVVGLIDIAMVGRLGPDAVAAVGYATQFFFLIQSALIAVGFACVALVARAIGGGSVTAARQSLAASLVVAVGTVIALATPVLAAPRALLELLAAEPNVIELTIPYMQLLLGSSFLMGVWMVFDSGLRANRNTATPMRIAAIVTAVKIGLNLVLIFGYLGFPRLELVGAGLASVVSQIIAVALFVIVLRREPVRSPVKLAVRDLASGLRMLGRVVKIAVPGVMERVIMNLALLSYFAVLGRYGTVAVAAYTVGVRILSFSWIPGTGFAAAAATLVGQYLGQGEEREAARTGWRSAGLALVVAIVLGAVFAVWRHELAALFISDPETITTLGPFMLCVAMAQPLLQVHFTLGGAHRGAGDTWTPMLAATVGNWLFRVPMAIFFASVLHADIVWIWAALIFDHLARVVWLVWTFQRGRWKRVVFDVEPSPA